MTENPEIAYYQSVVDDLRVAHERLSEVREQLTSEIDKKRTEIHLLRSIVAIAATYLTNPTDELRQQLDDAVWAYFDTKTVKS